MKRIRAWFYRYGLSISEPPVITLGTFFPLLVLLLMSLLAVGFHLIRIQFNEAVDFSLDWNLLLSWVPLLIAFIARYLSKRYGSLPLTMTFLSIAWLLFFPNAPYMITDLVHLTVDYQRDLTWHDVIMLFYYAQVSLINGLVSLYWIHQSWLRTYSRFTSRILLYLSFPLAGFGIFLGRVQRLNSWDLINNTDAFFSQLAASAMDRTALVLSVEFGLLLGSLYLVLWGLLRFRVRRMQ